MLIPELPGAGRLGRHVEHDERSRQYPVVRRAVPLRSRLWRRHVPIYDQGDLGSCTAQAICGAMSTGPFRHRFRSQRTVRSVYHAETVVDGFPGTWPPDDTGSSGLAACKVAKARGWITAYRHAFSLDDVIQALQDGPVIAGTDWLTGMDHPDSTGLVHATGDVRGGHEYGLVGVDISARRLRAANSWSDQWGDRGFFTIGWDDFASLLHRDGDVTVPIG